MSLESSDTELSGGIRDIVTPFLALQADCVATNGLTLLVCLLGLELVAFRVELEATEPGSLEPRMGLVSRDGLETFCDELAVLLELAFCVDVADC